MAQQTFEELVDAVKQAESRGKRYKDDGKTLTTSAKGALGEMQVMPKTIKDPGFGVTPAKDKSPDEIARVGVDYLQAMLGRYGDTEKALIAYNWGPGVTDKWLAAGANPDKLPAETRTYVQRVKGFLGGKDVPRETMAKKEREPLPPSLPPMAQAPEVKPEAAARVASLGPGYQAALALSFLAETDDEEDRKTTITQEYLAKAQEDEDERAAAAEVSTRQSNVFADLSNTTIRSPFAQPQQPVRMSEGGEPRSAKSLMERFKDLGSEYKKNPMAFMRENKVPTSPIGLALTAGYKTFKHVTGKDPLLDLQKELSERLDPEIDTGGSEEPFPISVGLPPLRRAEGSPEEGEVSARDLEVETARSIFPSLPVAEAVYLLRGSQRQSTPQGEMLSGNMGARIPLGKDAEAMLMLAGSRPEEGRQNSSNALLAMLNQRIGEGSIGAQMVRPMDAPAGIYAGGVSGSYPVGEGQVMGNVNMLRMPGQDPRVTGYGVGYGGKVGPGELSAMIMRQKDGPSSGQIQYRLPIGRAEGSPKEGERKLDRETITLMRGEGMQPAAMQRVKPPLELNPSAAGLPGLMMYNDPSLPGTGTAGYVMMGDDSGKNPAMAQAMFLNAKEGNKADTIAHETEHLLARQNLGRGSNINVKFDELIGDQNGLKRIQFVQKAVEAGPYLKEKYGLESAYFKPEMVEFQGRRAKNLLYEQLASLAALEQRHKIDLTKDPELRKTLFSRPDVRETYNALTGLRQTRLDPRDLPPHTRVPEPGMLDAIKGVFKRADGGMVYRANGGDAEPTAEELAAASTPAFIAQKSGIGRKAGNISKALQSGDAYIAAAKGVTEMPYNFAGASMDLAMLTRQALTGQAPAGQVGTSEYIKKMATEMGIRPAPPTDPTLRGFYDFGDIGSSALNPASIPRAAARGASAVAQKAGEAARDFQQYNRNLPAPGASYAVRNKGTPIAMSGLPFKSFVDEAEDAVNAVKVTRQGPLDVMDKPLGDWFSKKLTRYLRSDFATPDDQLVKAAEKGQLLHLAPKDFSDSASDQLLKSFLKRKQPDLEYMRQTEMNTKLNMATQPYGQRIEDLTDISAYPERVGDLTPNRVPPSMRNIVETRPETRVTDYAPGMVDNLKLNELRDKMLEVRQSNSLYGAYGQPEVKIPAEFLLPDKTLTDLNVAGASNRMAKYTNWQDNTRQRMATTSLREDPRFTRAPLQDGKYLGVALPDVRQNPEVKQLVLDVGCDGGWCTRYSQNAKSYGSGDSRLHIMVTGEGKKARPVAQFAIVDSGLTAVSGGSSGRFYIKEIKEKGNTTDFKNNPALPAIQEYVKFLDRSYGGLDSVDELAGLNMVNMREELRFPSMPHSKGEYSSQGLLDKLLKVNGNSYYASKDEFPTLIKKANELPTNAARQIQMNLFQPPKEKATGGMIERQPTDNRRYL